MMVQGIWYGYGGINKEHTKTITKYLLLRVSPVATSARYL